MKHSLFVVPLMALLFLVPSMSHAAMTNEQYQTILQQLITLLTQELQALESQLQQENATTTPNQAIADLGQQVLGNGSVAPLAPVPLVQTIPCATSIAQQYHKSGYTIRWNFPVNTSATMTATNALLQPNGQPFVGGADGNQVVADDGSIPNVGGGGAGMLSTSSPTVYTINVTGDGYAPTQCLITAVYQ